MVKISRRHNCELATCESMWSRVSRGRGRAGSQGSLCSAISCSHRYPCPGCTTIKINCCQIDHWPNIVSNSSSRSSSLLWHPPPPPPIFGIVTSLAWATSQSIAGCLGKSMHNFCALAMWMGKKVIYRRIRRTKNYHTQLAECTQNQQGNLPAPATACILNFQLFQKCTANGKEISSA